MRSRAIGYASGDSSATTAALRSAGLGPHSMSVIWTDSFAAGQRPPVAGALGEILEAEWKDTAEWAFTNLGLLEGDSGGGRSRCDRGVRNGRDG